MVSTVKATTFIKALHSGRTCPCLMLCEDNYGAMLEIVVKFRNGKESTPTGLICELYSSLFAQDLNMATPAPYIVDIDKSFYTGISDPDLTERFRKNYGLNFGSERLEAGYVTWPQGKSIPTSLIQKAAEILAFDLIVQNPDRRKDKPNLLRKGDNLVIFDHEMSFSFLYAIGSKAEFPWDGKGMVYAKDHLFYSALKGSAYSFDRLRLALEAIDNQRIEGYKNSVPNEWQVDNSTAAERIQKYLMLARNNSRKLFQKITEVLI